MSDPRKDPKRQRMGDGRYEDDDEDEHMEGAQDPTLAEVEPTVRDDPVESFIPGDGIETHCLVFYVGKFIDPSASIRTGAHWKDKTKFGYWMKSTNTLGTQNIRDIMIDSRDWEEECRQRRRTRKREIAYRDSDTADRRIDKGPTPQKPVSQQQYQRGTQGQATEYARGTQGQATEYGRGRQGSVQPIFPQQATELAKSVRHAPNTGNQYYDLANVRQSAPIITPPINTPIGRGQQDVQGASFSPPYGGMSPPPQQSIESGMSERAGRHGGVTPAPPSYQDATDNRPGQTPKPTGPKHPSGTGQPGWQAQTDPRYR